VRIPWDRDRPWQAVFLHEVAHNLQADLGIWQENRQALVRRLLGASRDPLITRIYGRWHKEIFADLAALLLGGPAAAWGMAIFLAHPAPRTLTYRPGSAHPTPYLRIHILVEMLRRMGFTRDAGRLERAWAALYDPRRFHRLPPRLLATSSRLIPHVVDEIAYQTRRNLAQRALADILPFTREDQQAIRAGAARLVAGQTPPDLPPRFLVSAAGYALDQERWLAAALGEPVNAAHGELLAGILVSPGQAERRIGEVHVAVGAECEVVRAVEALALIAFRHHGLGPVELDAQDAPIARLADHEPAARIEGEPVRAGGAARERRRTRVAALLQEHGHALIRMPAVNPVLVDIGVEQKAFAALPHRAID
jgi:hypothetical protein